MLSFYIVTRYGKTVAQLLIRWGVQHGYITIPKSVKPERIVENSLVFDFSISDDDMNILVCRILLIPYHCMCCLFLSGTSVILTYHFTSLTQSVPSFVAVCYSYLSLHLLSQCLLLLQSVILTYHFTSLTQSVPSFVAEFPARWCFGCLGANYVTMGRMKISETELVGTSTQRIFFLLLSLWADLTKAWTSAWF